MTHIIIPGVRPREKRDRRNRANHRFILEHHRADIWRVVGILPAPGWNAADLMRYNFWGDYGLIRPRDLSGQGTVMTWRDLAAYELHNYLTQMEQVKP